MTASGALATVGAATRSTISRRRFLRAGAAAAGLAAAAACTGADPPGPGPTTGVRATGASATDGRAGSRVAVVGAGLAGLNAAYQLGKLGHRATVYEARARVGGRVYSVTAGPGLVLDRGGSFVNTDHADLRMLVSELGLELHELGADPATARSPATAFHFGGRRIPEAEMADALRELAAQIGDDAARLEDDYGTWAPRFDPLSVADYLEQHTDKIGAPFARSLVEAALRSEYGAESDASSALQLLFMQPRVEDDRVIVVGTSDEAFVVSGGSGRVPAALAAALGDRIQLGRRLVRCAERGRTHELTFADGTVVETDWTIVTVPPAQLRTVEWELDLPSAFRRYVAEVDLGRNEKTFVGFDPKVWRTRQGFADDLWTDQGYDVAWDATARQDDRRDGALTFFTGGDRVGVRPGVGTLIERFDTVVAGADVAATGFSLRTDWANDRFARGAYANVRPGQLTAFDRFFWIEGESSVAFDTLVFAGEQFSDEWYGFMNGAVETGRLAARYVADRIG